MAGALKRGTLVTVAGGRGSAGKPRPAVILQDDRFSETASVTIALLTTTEVDAPLLRLPLGPTAETGLATRSFIMVDKLATVAHTRLGPPIGQLPRETLTRLRPTLFVFLGLTD
ncbi:type II toxin-antitoxin system PemK/MazF family toxin [Thermaurantiacus sp.]